MTPTSPLSQAISNNKMSAFQLALLDVDPSVPGWADDAIKRALYVPSKHAFLKALIKKGVNPAIPGADFFRVACMTDPTGESNRLLLKAGYRPDESVEPMLGAAFALGNLCHAPALIAALPAAKRKDVLCQLCAQAVLGRLSGEDIDKLQKLWKREPDAPSITRRTVEAAIKAKRPVEEIAEVLSARGWLDVAELTESELSTPMGRALRAKSEQDALQSSSPAAPASRRGKRL